MPNPWDSAPVVDAPWDAAPIIDEEVGTFRGIGATAKMAAKGTMQAFDVATLGRLIDGIRETVQGEDWAGTGLKAPSPVPGYELDAAGALVPATPKPPRRDIDLQTMIGAHPRVQELAENIAEREREMFGIRQSPAMMRWNQAEGVEAVRAFTSDPFEVTANIVVQGLAGSLPAVLASAVMGTAAGPAGTALGAGGGSFAVEYTNKILSSLREEGVDLQDANQLTAALSDPERMAAIRKKAVLRGVPVAVFDFFSGGIAGKLLAGARGVRSTIVRGTGEAIVQGTLAGGGEVAAEVAAGEKIQPKDIFAEIIAGPVTGAGDVAVNLLRTERAKDVGPATAAVVAAEPPVTPAEPTPTPAAPLEPEPEPDVEARGRPSRNIFDLPDPDLDTFFRERAEPAVEERTSRKYQFGGYEDFRDWMNARYAERDLEGMRDAFAEVGAPFKVQYIKENRGGDVHLKDWISHLATGSPLPTIDPPRPRTTPRPMPTGVPPPTTPPPTGGPTPTTPPGGPTTPPPPGAPPPGAPPPTTPPPPKPGQGIPPGKAVRASQIIKDLSDLMERPIRIGHIARGKRTMGIFKTKPEVARLRRANDIPTAAHETAHMLERIHRKALGNLSRVQWYSRLPKDVLNEFKGLDYDPFKRRGFEGFAEFVRLWITEGNTATKAPRAHAWFESTFLNENPNLRGGLNAIRDKAKAFRDQDAIKRVESMVQFDPDKEPLGARVGRKIRDYERLWLDDLATLEDVEKEIVGGNKTALGTASPSRIARMVTQGSGALARVWATQHMTDFTGIPSGPGLRQIFGRKGIKGDERAAILYAVAKRSQELWNRTDLQTGLPTPIDPGITKADADYAAQALETPARKQFAEEIAAWNRGALDYLRDAGGISQESFDAISAQNEAYIPFFRVWDEEQQRGFASGGRRIGDTPQAIKAIKGSGREILNPIETMLQHANQIIATADKTRIARSLVDLAESKEGFGQYVERIPPSKIPIEFDLGRMKAQIEKAGGDLSKADLDAAMTLFLNSPRTPTGGNIVAFVRDGKRQFYELHPELYRAIQALDYHRIHPVLDITAGKIARTQRLGATGIRAGFALFTNPVRDFWTLLTQGKGNPFVAAVQWGKHMAKQIGFRDNEIKNLWRAGRGEMHQPLGLDRKALRGAVDDVLNNTAKQKFYNVLKHPLEAMRAAMSFTEAAPRLAEYEMTLREMGWKPGQKVTADMAVEAANRAAEKTVNFTRAGTYGRTMNQLVPFFNPAVQGLSRFGRAHAENKLQSVAKGIGFIMLPAIANWWANKDDEEWQNFPDWIKYGFMNFKIGGEWVRIPTPFEWWYVYGAVPMSMLNAMYLKKPDEVRKALKQAVKQMTPPVMPGIMKPPVEAGMNVSFLTGRPLVSEAMKQLVPQEQAHPYTSTTARKVSEILGVGGVDVSPIKIEHVLNGYSGGFWSDIIGSSERLSGLAPSKEILEPADIPIIGRIFIRDRASAVIDEFYTEFMHLQSKQSTQEKLAAEGNEERAKKYELTEQQEQQLSGMHKNARDLARLRKEYRETKTREERNVLWKEMEEIAKEGLEK